LPNASICSAKKFPIPCSFSSSAILNESL